MEIKIETKSEKPLLSRVELQGRISFEAVTPSRAEVRKKLSEALKVDEQLVAVTCIDTDFGQKAALVSANVYKSKDAFDKYESSVTKRRHLSKEEKAKLKEDAKAKAQKAKEGGK